MNSTQPPPQGLAQPGPLPEQHVADSVLRDDKGSEIHDLGYRPYTGQRLGPLWSVRSLIVHSLRRALGLKRRHRLKIAPFLSIFSAWAPAIGMIFAASFVRQQTEADWIARDLVNYAGYANQISFAMLVFSVAVVPGVLTTDRTNGMLAMYLASPLTRTTYFLAKALSIFIVMLTITVGPILFMVIAAHLLGISEGGFVAFFKMLLRALAAGSLVSLCYGSIAMLVSSIPKRWAIASVGIFGAMAIPSIATTTLHASDPGKIPDAIAFLTPIDVVLRAWAGIFGERLGPSTPLFDVHSSNSFVIAALVWTLVLSVVTWWRYQTMPIDR